MKCLRFSDVVVVAVMLGAGLVSASHAPAAQSPTPSTVDASSELRPRLIGDWESDDKIWTFTATTVAISGGPGIGADATPYEIKGNTVSFKIGGNVPVSLVIDSITDKEMTVKINKDRYVFKRVKRK